MTQRTVLRSKDIERLDDVIDALDLCEEFGVSCDHLETLEEIKRRLWMHYYALKQGNIKKRVCFKTSLN